MIPELRLLSFAVREINSVKFLTYFPGELEITCQKLYILFVQNSMNGFGQLLSRRYKNEQ